MKWKLTNILLLLFTVSLLYGQSLADYTLLDMRFGLPESRIRALGQMPDGRIAIATAGTVTIYDGTHFSVYNLHPKNEFPLPDYHGYRHLTCDTIGMVWLRNDGSLYVIDTRQQQVVYDVSRLLALRGLTAESISYWPIDTSWKNSEEYIEVSSIVDDNISAMMRDSYGGLWVGLKESGILYKNALRRQQFHTTNAPFAYNSQYPFCSPRASQLSTKFAPSATNCTLDNHSLNYTYLGTRNGIMIINREERLVATLDEHYGLSKNNVVALINDRHGDVWAATANGLTRIRQTGRDSFDIVNYGVLDGIDTNGREFRTCQIHCDTSGLITAGFVGGICTFHPDSVIAPRYTFHFPKNDYLAETASPSFRYWWLAVLLLAGVCAVGAAFLFRHKSRKTTQNNDEALSAEIVTNTVEENKKDVDKQFLERLHTIIEQHIADEDFSVLSLSEMMAMDRTVLYRRMQTLTGVSPSVYIKNIRMSIARQLLSDTNLPIGDIAMKTGFSTTKYFSAAFKDAFGMTPKEYREQNT